MCRMYILVYLFVAHFCLLPNFLTLLPRTNRFLCFRFDVCVCVFCPPPSSGPASPVEPMPIPMPLKVKRGYKEVFWSVVSACCVVSKYASRPRFDPWTAGQTAHLQVGVVSLTSCGQGGSPPTRGRRPNYFIPKEALTHTERPSTPVQSSY